MICRLRSVILSGVLACAGISAYGADSAEAVLRLENARLREQLQQQNRELQQIRLWLGNVSAGDGKLPPPEREQAALNALDNLSKSGMETVLQIDRNLRELRVMLRQIQLSEVQKAQIALRLDGMEAALQKFILLTAKGGENDCRIVAVDRKLGIVIISGGLSQGTFPGMVFRPRNGNSRIRMRVVGVRPELAAAELIAGAWEELTPGTSLTAFSSDSRRR